jgi:2-amino-4-hydroxy-6-hydroxymethyldihydropteridine diphosphokinase
MARIYFSLGSNIDAIDNIRLGVGELEQRFGNLETSHIYRSAAVGFEGPDFLNLVAAAETSLSPAAIHDVIESIHLLAGRSRTAEKFASRPLDIDLLLYDDLVIDEPALRLPRSDILDYSFVLKPLVELAPEFVHPVTGKTLARHWQEHDQQRHALRPVADFLAK